ncbi:hypothetical protein [Ferrovibrio terrae]|uniref:hypothetical protein n=1 Tax=Ferrovibrio terrae TaxID=2594003 RepID=UPI0031383446
MDWLKKRIGERTTWVGLASIIAGVGQIAKVSEAPAVADAVANVGVAVSTGTVDPMSLLITGLGTYLIGMRDRAK